MTGIRNVAKEEMMLSFPGWQGILAVIGVSIAVVLTILFFAKKLE